MAATGELTPMSQFFEEQFKEAWKLFKHGSFDEANELSQDLLMEPALSDLHKAGLHLILAHSPDEYVFHATQAVRLYENLYGPGETLTDNQTRSRDALIAGAKRVLSECLADEAELRLHNRDYTEDDLQQDIDQACDELMEHQQKMQEEMEEMQADTEVSEEGPDVVTGEVAGQADLFGEDSEPLLPTPPVSRGTGL